MRLHLIHSCLREVNALYEQRAALGLEPEAVQLLERYHTQLMRAGARLSDAEKSRLKAINSRISCLTTHFKQNVFKATSDGAVVVDSVAELDGLAAEQIGAGPRRLRRRVG